MCTAMQVEEFGGQMYYELTARYNQSHMHSGKVM